MSESILPRLIKLSFKFEIFFPRLIKLFINQKLKEYKEMGKLTDYKFKAKRKGKYHYFFELDLLLNIGKGGEVHE
jgi:hypothetical protein